MRKIACDTDYRLPVGELERAIEKDRAEGKRPFCVIANAGTTNTGAIDPLSELSRLCKDQHLWLHVDGAYGAAAVICDRGRELLGGLELADSLSLDPHKWLFQPFEIGCVVVRDLAHLRDTFLVFPEYLKDTHQYSDEFNFTDHGLQLTRGFRALKLWMSIKVFGMASFRAAVERGFAAGRVHRGAASQNARLGDRDSRSNGHCLFPIRRRRRRCSSQVGAEYPQRRVRADHVHCVARADGTSDLHY